MANFIKDGIKRAAGIVGIAGVGIGLTKIFQPAATANFLQNTLPAHAVGKVGIFKAAATSAAAINPVIALLGGGLCLAIALNKN